VKLWVIGVGPGDPKLLTLAALEVLQKAELVFAPLMGSEASSRAYQVVKVFLPDHCKVVQLCFDGDERKISQTILDEIARYSCEEAVFLVLGDPLLYGSFFKLFPEIQKKANLEIKIIPGISAYQVMGARLGIPIAQGDEVVSIVPGTVSLERFKALLELSDTLLLYKLALFLRQGFLVSQDFCKGWVGENLSTDKEKIYPLPRDSRSLPYFSMAILKKA